MDQKELIAGKEADKQPGVPKGAPSPPIDSVTESRNYWMKRVASLPPGPELPLTVPLGASSEFERREAEIGEPIWKSLKSRAAEAGFSAEIVLIAALAEVLGVWSKSPHFVLTLLLSASGAPEHRREDFS